MKYMATFEIIEGAPGQGKSLYSARIILFLLERNKKWFNRSGIRRMVCVNLKLSEQVEKEHGEFLRYWSDISELCTMRDCDIVWDEIATEIDSRNWVNLSQEVKRFLSQYRKRGVDIYANTQDFSMVDVRARLMITKVLTLSKVIGSADISATKPKPKRIWGLIFIREVENWRELNPEKKQYSLFGFSMFFITKKLVSMYDTTQDIVNSKKSFFAHNIKHCVDCNFEKVVHT